MHTPNLLNIIFQAWAHTGIQHWNPLVNRGRNGQKIMNSQSSEHISHVYQEGNVGAPNPPKYKL